jgi:hypothetical protein
MKRFILWDYSRATWQYDVMVGLILAFIFLTPREMFRDTPRPGTVTMLPSNQGEGENVFWLDPSRLDAVPEGERNVKALSIVNSSTASKQKSVVRIEAVFDDEKELRGFLAFTRP